jgi:hypothetical protein
MKIDLKNVKFSEFMSEETNAFVADVFINGVKAAYAKNDGHGGCTYYHSYEGKNDLVREAEQHCLTLPPIDYGNFKVEMNLENKIDFLFEEWLKKRGEEKFEKKLKKDMSNGLCIKTENGYSLISFNSGKRKVTIEQLLAVPNGREAIKNSINKYKAEGKEILNTNIPQELI